MTNLPSNYRQVWTAKSKSAMEMKAHFGDFPGCAPVGYINKRDTDKAWVEIDPSIAPLVKEAFKFAGQGKYSLRKILKDVTDKGLVSRNGKSLGISALWKVLTNPFYIGQIRYNGEMLLGNHEPLIDRKLFEKVKINLDMRCKTKNSRQSFW